jgi:hypothetical protein
MDKKITNTFIISSVFIVLAVLLYFAFFFNFKGSSIVKKDINTVTDAEIIEILKTNKDAAEYIKKYPDFKIVSREILTKDSILAGQNGKNFQPVYIGLVLENSRYMKINLINQIGSEGFIAVIDFSDSTVQKAFGLLLFQASANSLQNGTEVTP